MQLALRRHLLASSVLIGASMFGTAAYAQTGDAAQAGVQTADSAPADDGTIVVTGSLITNPNLERSTPVNVTTSEEVELRQTNVAEQLLREIPGVVPSIGSAVNNGNGGASFVDLRGLGSFRNIVLLDGNRIAPSGLVGRVDLNNIPLALIERTEVLTGGASTTYGADAVSGVVNFITKQNFSGLEASISEQITERGDGNYLRADVVIGANFDDGRGNAVLSLGYQEADPVYQGARAFSRYNFSAFGGAVSGSGTTVPSRFSVPGQGTRAINPTTGALQSAFVPYNFNPFNIFQTPFERFNIYGQANYEIADGLEVYTRGLFSKNTVDTIIAPSGAFGIPVQISLNNPFLPASARATFCANNDSNPLVPGIQTLTPDQCTLAAAALNRQDPNYREITTALSRRTPEVGPRISSYTTTIFDYRLGFRGSITDSINFDLSGAYGESENIQSIQGYTLNSRFRQGLLTNRTAAGAASCQDTSNGCVPINVFGAEGSITPEQVAFLNAESSVRTITSLAQARATISGDFGAALPWAEDAISFAIGGEYRQYQASVRADTLGQSGDLGGAGGATPTTIGGFDVYEAFGELVAPLVQDKPFFQSLTLEAGIRYSHYTVESPNRPKFNTTTWKAGGSWEPISSIKVRGNYSRAVRAPNISELFSPQNTGLTSLSNDPCASLNDNNQVIRPAPTGTLRSVCLAQGAPTFTLGNIPQPTAGQANITTGGNLNLRPEKSNSYTIGVVLQPEFIPGFSLSVDYYNIKLTGAITTPTTGDLINACFGAPDAAGNYSPAAGAENTVACTQIRRNQLTGGLAGDPSVVPGLFGALTNLGKIKTNGVDLTMNYNTDLGFAKLALSFAGNWTHENRFLSNSLVPVDPINNPFRNCVGYISVNCGSLQPEFSWTQRTTFTFDNVDLSLLWRHISAFQQEPLDRDFGNGPVYSGPLPSNSSPLPGAPALGSFGNRNLGFIEAYDYFDLATRIGVGDNLTFTFTVANLFDKKPPLTGQDIGTTSFNSGNTFPSTYDALGRSYRVSARLRF
jgi:outer membrane receptor protein involved in Fe transport